MAKERPYDLIPWKDLIDLLTQQDAFQMSGTAFLERGSRFDEVRRAYPACDLEFIKLIHKATANLRERQNRDVVASPEDQEVLSNFYQDKRALCGAVT